MENTRIFYSRTQRENKFIRIDEENSIEVNFLGKYYDVTIWESNESDVVLQEVESIEIVSINNIIYIMFCENAKWGAMDIERSIYIPAQYDVIKRFDMNNGALVIKDGKQRYYHSFYGEFASREMCELYAWLELEEFDKPLKMELIEMFFRVELNIKITFDSLEVLKEVIKGDFSNKHASKIATFFKGVRSPVSSYGRDDCYNYREIFYRNISSYQGKINLREVEKVFEKYGKTIRFWGIKSLQKFIDDESNESFLVKYGIQIAYSPCLFNYE